MADVIELEHALARAFDDGLIAPVGGGELGVPAAQAAAQSLQQDQRKNGRHQAEDDARDQGDDIAAEQSLQ